MTGFLLQLCFASACSHQLLTEKRLVRYSRLSVVASSRRTTSPRFRQHRHRRWRCALTPHPYLLAFYKKQRLSLPLLPSPSLSAPLSSSCPLRRCHLLDRLSAAHAHAAAADPRAPHLPNAIDRAAVQHLFELSSRTMESPLADPAPPPQPRVGSSRGAGGERESQSEAAAAPSSRSGSSSSESMPPPPLPPVSTPRPADHPEESVETRPSRSESTASRSNRLSLTLPIAPPTALPTRPVPTSATTTSFPTTPLDLASGLASPAEPADLITAIAAQERRVLELREELSRAESSLSRLKRQWAHHEDRKKRGQLRKTEPLRSLSSRPGGAPGVPAAAAVDPPAATTTATTTATTAPVDEAATRRAAELNRRKALLLGQQPGADPDTPTQSQRRVFRGSHTRALSLLSPSKSSSSDGFSVHEDHPDDELLRSPTSAHSQEPDSPFLQNLGRYAPLTAAQLSKRASWAPQSGHQVAGLKQVAGDLTATLWTFVEDLRQATVGDEIAGPGGAMRHTDASGRAGGDDAQNSTIRGPASAPGRPHLSRPFDADVQNTPTPPSRYTTTNSNTGAAAGEAQASASGSSNGKARAAKSPTKTADAKTPKRFSWTPLVVDAYDDNDWTSWDSPSVKSPRWSGSTVNSDSVATSIPEQENENTTPQKQESSSLSSFSPASPSASRTGDLAWPAALNRLSPGNIKRTATDLMKEWEKSLSPPTELAASDSGSVEGRT